MTEQKATSVLSRLTLPSTPFFRCTPNGDNLFTVREGVPADAALEQASCFLASARESAYSAAHPEAAYLIEMAKGIVDAVSAADLRADAVRETGPAVSSLSEYQRGGLAFKSLLIELHALHQRSIDTTGNDDYHGFMRALVTGMDSTTHGGRGDHFTGFMMAFAVWMELTIGGTNLDVDRWDVLADLAGEGGEP